MIHLLEHFVLLLYLFQFFFLQKSYDAHTKGEIKTNSGKTKIILVDTLLVCRSEVRLTRYDVPWNIAKSR
jgi:hypothetical protein